MRRAAWGALLLFAFVVPWDVSLNLGPPLGNSARLVGLAVLLAAIPAVLQAGCVRKPGWMQWLVLAFYLWWCCTGFWTVDSDATLVKLRAYFQDLMVVWLVWEFGEGPGDLRWLLRAYVAGSWVLACLTLANFASPEAIAAGQIRFVASGQDPNDAARFLDLGFPLAALLWTSEKNSLGKLLAGGYLPLGLAAVVLTASREGFLAAVVAFAGCLLLVGRSHPRTAFGAVAALPAVSLALWLTIPKGTFERLATIPGQFAGGDLNQRWNIWGVGWDAFMRSPILGSGAGSFVQAAGLAPTDTAHNTVLSILVCGGLCALLLAGGILAAAVRAVLQTTGSLRWALATTLLVWALTSFAASVEENRTTWLLLAIIALAGRLATEKREELAACFSLAGSGQQPGPLVEAALQPDGQAGQTRPA